MTKETVEGRLPFTITKELCPCRQINIDKYPIHLLEVGDAMVIHRETFDGSYHELQKQVRKEGKRLGRMLRTRGQPNFDLKVYRVA